MQKMIQELSNLDTSKATQKSDITTKLIKRNCDIFSQFLNGNFINIIVTGSFPEQLKNGPTWNRYIKMILESIRKTTNLQYAPWHIKNLWKMFVQAIEQLFWYDFTNLQWGIRKGFSLVNCLLPVTEKWRESIEQGVTFGPLLTISLKYLIVYHVTLSLPSFMLVV